MVTVMKYIQSMFTLVLMIFCIGTIVTSCMDSKTKVDNIQSTSVAAKEKFVNDEAAFEEDMEVYKGELFNTYEKNKSRIEKLREDKKKMMELSYKEKVEELEIANEIVKNKIETVDIKSNLEWKNLKKEINQDLENLEESFKEITVKI